MNDERWMEELFEANLRIAELSTENSRLRIALYDESSRNEEHVPEYGSVLHWHSKSDTPTHMQPVIIVTRDLIVSVVRWYGEPETGHWYFSDEKGNHIAYLQKELSDSIVKWAPLSDITEGPRK